MLAVSQRYEACESCRMTSAAAEALLAMPPAAFELVASKTIAATSGRLIARRSRNLEAIGGHSGRLLAARRSRNLEGVCGIADLCGAPPPPPGADEVDDCDSELCPTDDDCDVELCGDPTDDCDVELCGDPTKDDCDVELCGPAVEDECDVDLCGPEKAVPSPPPPPAVLSPPPAVLSPPPPAVLSPPPPPEGRSLLVPILVPLLIACLGGVLIGGFYMYKKSKRVAARTAKDVVVKAAARTAMEVVHVEEMEPSTHV